MVLSLDEIADAPLQKPRWAPHPPHILGHMCEPLLLRSISISTSPFRLSPLAAAPTLAPFLFPVNGVLLGSSAASTVVCSAGAGGRVVGVCWKSQSGPPQA